MKLNRAEKIIIAASLGAVVFASGFFAGRVSTPGGASGSYEIIPEKHAVSPQAGAAGGDDTDVLSVVSPDVSPSSEPPLSPAGKDGDNPEASDAPENPGADSPEPPASPPGETASEPPADSKAEEVSGLVNINTADKDELMTLPMIGEVRASAIISYRESAGPFSSRADIMQVSGIGEGIYNQVKDLITVG